MNHFLSLNDFAEWLAMMTAPQSNWMEREKMEKLGQAYNLFTRVKPYLQLQSVAGKSACNRTVAFTRFGFFGWCDNIAICYDIE